MCVCVIAAVAATDDDDNNDYYIDIDASFVCVSLNKVDWMSVFDTGIDFVCQ